MRRVTLVRTVRVALVLALITVVVGCQSGFRANVERIAANIGRNADDVERGFRAALPGATESELEQMALRTADDTQWIKTIGRQLAAEWEEQATLRAVAGSTCDVVGLYDELGSAMT